MGPFPQNLQKKLDFRKETNAFRQLETPGHLVDFSSNDYLGFARAKDVFEKTHAYLMHHNMHQNGSTGSRLLSGNHPLYAALEAVLCEFHQSAAALVFNSGYDANLGFFSCVPQRGDIILFDEYIHASIRDGISMSHAKAYKFKHNNIEDLSLHLARLLKTRNNEVVYIVTESVFSMDGDSPDLETLVQLCKAHTAHLIIDEAHAVGVFGENGVGLVQKFGIEKEVFARLVTFGKALGCHGAAILGSETLKEYLVNFSRSLIYTTALPPHSLATVHTIYNELYKTDNALSGDQHREKWHPNIRKLHQNIMVFKAEIKRLKLNAVSRGEAPEEIRGFIESDSAIHSCVIPGNAKVKHLARILQSNGYGVKPILSPTVPKGQERLRFCLHAYNSEEEIIHVLETLSMFEI
nr:8-amino-7-oxononanoate synthase [Aestuariivivens sediminis]